MYNIDLNDNEIIIYNNDEVSVLNNDKKIDVSLVITNQRLIVLQDGNKLGNMNNVLRTTKAIGLVPNREIIFQTLLVSIVGTIPGEYVKIVLNNNTFIEIKDKNIIHILENRN